MTRRQFTSPIAHRIPFSQHHLYYKHVSPIVQLDVADVQEVDYVPVVADYNPNDNEIELFKVPPPCRSLCYIAILSPTHASTTTRRRPCTEWSRPSNMMVSTSLSSYHSPRAHEHIFGAALTRVICSCPSCLPTFLRPYNHIALACHRCREKGGLPDQQAGRAGGRQPTQHQVALRVLGGA